MIDLLILLLKPALRAAEGGSRKWYDLLAVLIAYPLDIVIAHTSWALVAGRPQPGEWTVSQCLERLVLDTQHQDHTLFVALARRINRASPTGQHIPFPDDH